MNEIAKNTKLSMEYMKVIRTHHEQCDTCDFDRLYIFRQESGRKKNIGAVRARN